MKKEAKKRRAVQVYNSSLDIPRISISGGIFTSIIFLILTIGGKFFGLFNQSLNILLDIFSPIGYDVSYFGLFLGIVYGFITGYLLFALFSYIYSKIPGKN